MNEFVSYGIAAVGLLVVALGLYGLLMPELRRHRFSFGWLRRPRNRDDDEDDLDQPFARQFDDLLAAAPQGRPRVDLSAEPEASAPAAVSEAAAPAETAISVVSLAEEDESDEDELDDDSSDVEEEDDEELTAILVEPETPAEAPTEPAAEPVATAKDGNDLLSFFEEATEVITAPAALLGLIQPVAMADLLTEAREVAALIRQR